MVYLSILFLAVKLLISPYFGDSDLEDVGDKTLSYICDFGIIVCCFFCYKIIHKKFNFIFLSFILLTITFSVSTIYHDGGLFDAIKSLLRLFVPFLFFSVICSYFFFKKEELINVSKYLVGYVVILTIIGLLFLPPSENRWDDVNAGLWWPAYFSGLHTTTYVVIAASFVVFSMNRIGAISTKISAFFFVGTFLAVAFGWGVRTTALSMIVLVAAHSYYKYFSRDLKSRSIVKFFSLLVATLYFFVLFDWSSIDAVSSGRLSMYEFKYHQLMDNSFIAWIIGNGAGSDIVETDFWWWAAKGAHSDVLTFIVEGGIIFLSVFMFILFRIVKMINGNSINSVIVALFITSVFSNGFFVRPLALYFVLFSIALLYVNNGETELAVSK